MKARVSRTDFLNELTPMQGVVERRTTIPVLSHIMLSASDGKIKVAATDLEVSLTSWCKAEVKEEGAIAIQAKKLIEIIRASSGDDVNLEIKSENTLSIIIDRSRFSIRGLSAEDFPTLPLLEEDKADVEIEFKLFKYMISKVFFAISSEDSRFQLSGALLQATEGVLTLVATDGHRLALVENEFDGDFSFDGVLIPRKVLQELQRFEGGMNLIFNHGTHHLSFSVDRRQLICRILEGTFPDYERVITKSNDKTVVVDRKLLSDIVHRVGLLTGERTRAIKVDLKEDLLVLSATNPDLGEAVEELPCDYRGDSFNIGLNPDYIREFLSSSGAERVRFDLKDENSQCVASPVEGKEKRHVCVIMPIRL